ncbi:hypothetical protein PISMIDRAFT_681413 [Pisolithus microcarpus 441]|uniref:Uncharacterized protein n=1 Tax=Pisolithus microcarpus 441 TaxID=765257 RepID=A0A0C9ZG47_9AGAM|nr:hypothetical protein BKA83DRAFT_681413 [Pisolithus microcarpus]KIK21422.1 hypothetical protein PISMIDRAFT_681413 [Pisolithus microcarpus 441]
MSRCPLPKTTGVIEDTEPMKKLPASSISRGNHESRHSLVMLHLCDPQPATSLNPISVVAYLNSIKD